MNIAKEYLEKQFAVVGFKHSYLEEKTKLDVEYQLEELKKDIQAIKPVDELIKKIETIERYILTV